MKYTRSLVAFLFLLASFFVTAESVFAQGQAAGIRLIPATIERAADPGEFINEELTITNISDEEKEYFLYKRNIKGVEGGGTPIFADSDAEVTGFEISEWISFENNSYVLAPGEELTIPITIAVPDNASPGSHFGGIFASVEPPRIREIGAGVGYEVASVISIRINGDVIDATRIRSFYTDKLFYGSKNVDFTATIENQGNILVRPRGPLTITSMFGGDPTVFTVNDNLAGVFPGSTRDLEFSWEDEGLGFGRYEAILALVYDGESGQRTIDASVIFWVFPLKVIIPIIVSVLLVLLLGYIFARMYVKNALNTSSGTRRRIAPARYRKQVGISRFVFVTIAVLATLLIFLITLFLFFA